MCEEVECVTEQEGRFSFSGQLLVVVLHVNIMQKLNESFSAVILFNGTHY